MKQVLKILFCLFLLSASSCITLKQKIRIDGPNRGIYNLDLKINDEVYKKLQGTVYGKYFDKKFGAQQFSEANGFKITHYTISQGGGSHQIEIHADIVDLKKAIKSGQIGHFILNQKNGTNELYYSFKFLNEGQKKMDAELLKDVHLSLKLTVGKIVATNAHKADKRTASWEFNGKSILSPKSEQLFIKYQDP